jgi:hypothetical protein
MRPQIPEKPLRNHCGVDSRRQSGVLRLPGANQLRDLGQKLDDNGLTMAQLKVESKAGETRLIVRLPVRRVERTARAEAIVATHAYMTGLTVQLKATG